MSFTKRSRQISEMVCEMADFGKCKCLQTGHGNLDVNYKMGDSVLGMYYCKREGLKSYNKH